MSELPGRHMSDCKKKKNQFLRYSYFFRVMSGSEVLHTKLFEIIFPAFLPLWTHTNTHLLDSAGNCLENLAEKQNLTQNSSLMAQSS